LPHTAQTEGELWKRPTPNQPCWWTLNRAEVKPEV